LSDWTPFEDGDSLGTKGSEGGTILIDLEHPQGARITLERGGEVAPFAITCGVFGWIAHTRFFAQSDEATGAFSEMLSPLAELSAEVRLGPRSSAAEATEAFVRRFP